MKKDKANSHEVSSLRHKAEEQLKALQSKKEALMGVGVEQSQNESDILRLNHELEVHHIELEMQNEELRQALNQAETAIALYDFSPVGYFTIDRDGTISQMNLSGAEMLGSVRSVLTNSNIKLFVSLDTLPLFNDFLLKAFETNTKQSCEVKLGSQKNVTIVQIDGIVSINEQKCHLTALDITKRTLFERAVKENEEKYRLMVDLSPDGVIIHSNEKIIFANASALSFIGASSLDQIKNKSVIDFVHPDYRSQALERIKNIYLSREPSGYSEEKFININKKVIDVEVIGIPINYMEKPVVQTIVRNITNRKKAEEDLLRSEARYKTMFANMGDVISLVGSDGILKYISPNLEKYFGWKPEEIIGTKEGWDLIHPEELNQLLTEFSTLTETDNAKIKSEFRIKCKDGSWKWVEITAVNRVSDPNINGVIVNYHDFSDRKMIEVQIQEQRRFFEQVFSQSSVSTQILDKDGWCEKINPKLSELFGVKPEDIEGKKYNIFKDESVRKEGIIPILNTVFKEGKTATWDVFFDIGIAAESQHIKVADKNKKRWFHNWAYPIFDEEGLLAQVIIQHTDITNRKRVDERLSDSETRYRRLFESAKDGILILDAGSRQIMDVNPNLIQMLGYSQDELLGKELWEVGVFKNIADSKLAIIELVDKGSIRYDDMILQTKTGNPIHVEFVSNVYMVDDKKVIQCNIRDITERLQAEKEIHTLGKAIEQGPSSIVITDAEGKIEFVNQKFTALTLYNLQEVKGKSPRIFNPGRLPENEFVELWETLKEGKTWEGQVLNRRKDYTNFWEEVSISSVKSGDGTISNYILIQNDISEKKQTMIDLVKAKEKAVESDRLKSAFLANMSHEIRTPLNSIIGFSELMAEPEFDVNQLFHYSQIITNSGIKLLTIISDIMDLSKIEAGEVQFNSSPLSVNQLILDIQKEYLFKAVEKDIELRVDVPVLKDIVIESDENKLRQVLSNFVGNAIKFTDKGFVEIGVKADGEFIQFHVKDTGIGIPAEFQLHIFERFRQIESAFSRKHGGNGLGLAISKSLVELMGGQVWIETETGKGSTFYFTLPILNYPIQG